MKKRMKRIAAAMLTSALVAGICANDVTPVLAATEHWNDASEDTTAWDTYKTNWATLSADYEKVSLTPGEDESQLNFAWYCKTSETPQVRFATSQEALETATAVAGSQEAITLTNLTDYFSNKVTITGLAENTTYYYQVYKNGAWSDAETYSTHSFSNYSILYVGDPQIGASKGQTSSEGDSMSESDSNLAARNDSYNWNNVLNNALAAHPAVSFLISAGDQVNTATNEEEYAGYLGADALSSLPVATTIGNHDSKSSEYSLHYNNPNSFSSTDTGYVEGSTSAGSDYYYTYGDVLFIVLDTNNLNCGTHENVIKKAIEENQDAKWRVVTFHQDIYGSGADHSASDGIVLRTQLTPILDENDIDVVLQGHDHTYSRSYQLTSNGTVSTTDDSATNDNCYVIASDVTSGSIVNPEGTVYFEANSATGSKFYNLISTQQDYIAERSQTWSPSYSVIDVSENALTVTTYDAETNAVMDGSSSYTIVKEADKSGLKETVDTANTKLESEADYTAASVAALKEAVSAAQKVVDNTNAAQTEIEEALTAVSQASANLVLKTAQTLTGTASYSKKLGDSAITLDTKTSGDGALTYESSDEDVCVVSKSGKVRFTGVGTATITVTAAATDTYQSAEKKVTIKVAKKDAVAKQAVMGTKTYSKVYGDKAFSLGMETSGDGKLTYSSSNSKIVSVSSKGKVTIKGTGKAVITVKAAATDTYKAASAKVTITVKPAKTTIASAKSSAKKTMTVTWKKASTVSGYEIAYATDKNFKKSVSKTTVGKSTTVKTTVKKLTSGKKYYVKVRAYTTISGKKVYGAYSSVKSVTVK